jgi:tetratricopeptide (TPR) repeat protein
MKFYNPITLFIISKYYLKGLICLRSSKYLEAVSFLQKALTHAKENHFSVYDITKYLGITYWQDEQYQKGKQTLLEAERICLNSSNKKSMIDSELAFYLGLIYDKEAVSDTAINLKKAREYYQFAIKAFRGNILDQLTDIDLIASRLIKIDEWFRKAG